MKYRLLLCIMIMGCGMMLQAQQSNSMLGEIKGKVIDSKTKAPLDFVSIQLELQGVVKAQCLTDDEGNFTFKQLQPGKYRVKATFVGYNNMIVEEVEVHKDNITAVNIPMETAEGIALKEVVIKKQRSMVDPEGKGGSVVTSKEIMRLPQRNINMIANTTRGVNGGTPVFRGSRSDGTAYYVDGVRTNRSDETYAHVEERGFISVKNEPLHTFSIDVDKASYSVVRSYLRDRILPPKDAVRVEEMINYFKYDVDGNATAHPFYVKAEVANSPWDASKKLVHVVLRSPDMDMKDAVDNNLVFLIDVSGSMLSEDKLPLLKTCLKMLVEKIRPDDKVSIVVYAGAAGLVLPATNGKHKEDINTAIDQLSAGGSTAGGAGIMLAYDIAEKQFIKGGNNRIILATDGDFNVGVSSVAELTKLIESKRETGVFLSVLGFGTGNINDQTMELLADKGNGNYHYIDNLLEGKKVLLKEMGGTLYTVAKDVKIQVEFNPAFVKSYRLIGYENRLLNAEDFNDDKKDAGELGAGQCVTAIYEIMTKDDGVAAKTDSLKYQEAKLTTAALSNELMLVKVRYKKPDANKSVKFEIPVMDNNKTLEASSEEMRFAMSVAMFGMKLKESDFAKVISYDEIMRMSKAAKGTDDEGYRAEFIRMVETAQLLAAK